jgi:hypothetical protein
MDPGLSIIDADTGGCHPAMASIFSLKKNSGPVQDRPLFFARLTCLAALAI